MPIVPAGNLTKSVATGTPYSPAVSFNPDKKNYFDTHPTTLGHLAGGPITTDGANITVPTGYVFIHNGIVIKLTANFVVAIPGIAFPKYIVASNVDETPGSQVNIDIQGAAPVAPTVLLGTIDPNNNTIVFPPKISIRALSERLSDLEDNTYAATTRVHPTAGVGDATTVQGGLNALPARGGRTYLREGLYSLAAAISVPNDVKEVEIVGSGSGFNDSLGTVIDTGANGIAAFRLLGNKHVKLSNMRIRSNGTAGSIAIQADAPDDSNFIDLENVVIDGFEKGFKIVSGTLLVRGNQVYITTTGKAWEGVGQFEGSNCQINGSSVSGPVSFIGNNLNLVLEGAVNEILAFILSDSFLCGEYKINNGGQLMLSSCTFQTLITQPNRYLDILVANPSAMVGCNFLAQGALHEVRVASNYFSMTDTVGLNKPRVVEVGGANNNYFERIDIPNSTIIGTATCVNYVYKESVTGGNTTDAFVAAFPALSNPNGLPVGVGGIRNTGANAMEVKETVTDLWGTSVSRTQTVAAGGELPLRADVNIATGRPPYSSYEVLVQSTVPGNPTTYNLRFSCMGAK